MFLTLLKIRIKGLFNNSNAASSKKKQSKLSKPAIMLLLAFCIVYFAFLIGLIFYFIASFTIGTENAWIFFGAAASAAFLFSVIGTVFATKTQIYSAKDNDLLLSMPIPPSTILGSRVAAVVGLAMLDELLFFLPAAAGWIVAGGNVTASGVIFYVLTMLFLPFLSVSVSCLFGWILAVITRKIVHKSIFQTAIAVVFVVLWIGFVYSLNIDEEQIVAFIDVMANPLRAAWLPYIIGSAISDGNIINMLISIAVCVVPFVCVYALLSKTFLKIATTAVGAKAKKYSGGELRTSSVKGAIIKKELSHFVSSSVWLLNCGLSLAMAAIFAVFLSVKIASAGESGIFNILPQSTAPLVIAALLSVVSSTSYISAPSISLEGKSMWILHAAPVKASDVLLAKAAMHMIVAVPVVGVAAIVSGIIMGSGVIDIFAMILAPTATIVFSALLGVVMNLLFPRLDWTNETTVVKQGMAVFLAMMIGMASSAIVCGGIGALAFVILPFVPLPSIVFSLIYSALFVLASLPLYLYINGKSAERRFEAL